MLVDDGATDWRGGSCMEPDLKHAHLRSCDRWMDLKGGGLEDLNDLETDPLLLERTMVHPIDTVLDLEFRVRFGRSPMDWWRSRLCISLRFVALLRLVLPRT